VCSSPTCQRQRRADYHQQKLREDPSYREQCRDSQRKWREKNPTYFTTYAANRRTRNRTEPARENPPGELSHLLNQIKNNVALDVKPVHTTVWILGASEKNTLAVPQVIVLYGGAKDIFTVPVKRTTL
jgi:hypothetical protein